MPTNAGLFQPGLRVRFNNLLGALSPPAGQRLATRPRGVHCGLKKRVRRAVRGHKQQRSRPPPSA